MNGFHWPDFLNRVGINCFAGFSIRIRKYKGQYKSFLLIVFSLSTLLVHTGATAIAIPSCTKLSVGLNRLFCASGGSIHVSIDPRSGIQSLEGTLDTSLSFVGNDSHWYIGTLGIYICETDTAELFYEECISVLPGITGVNLVPLQLPPPEWQIAVSGREGGGVTTNLTQNSMKSTSTQTSTPELRCFGSDGNGYHITANTQGGFGYIPLVTVVSNPLFSCDTESFFICTSTLQIKDSNPAEYVPITIPGIEECSVTVNSNCYTVTQTPTNYSIKYDCPA